MTRQAELEVERQRLALDAEQRAPGALKALERVEAEIAALHREEERAALAQQERTAREQAAQRAEQDTRQRELEARLAACHAERTELAQKVEVALDGAVEAIARLTALGREMYGVSADLGHPRRRLMVDEHIGGYLAWRLSPFIRTLSRPDRAYRRPLTEILEPTLHTEPAPGSGSV